MTVSKEEVGATLPLCRLWLWLGAAALAVGCTQSHVGGAGGGGADAGADAGACEAPAVTAEVRSDYTPGVEVASITLEVNDFPVAGVVVRTGSDLLGGVTVGRICGLQPNTRVTVRLIGPRGGDVAGRQLVVDEPVDGEVLRFVVTR